MAAEDANNTLPEKQPLKSKNGATLGGGDAGRCPDPEVYPGDSEICVSAGPGPPIPPDGGYGWVIMGASFFVNFLVDGVCFSFGIFFLEFLDHYQEGKEKTAWVGSVLNGMYLSMGPLAGALANKFGCRLICIIGSVMVSASLIVSTLSPNIPVLILTYGFLTGAGFGLMYLPAIVMVGYYFEKRRALATGIAVCGSGIGGFVFAPLCEKLIDVYAWKGATWIIAGICLNGIVCGCLFRPLEHPKKKRRTVKTARTVEAAYDKCAPERQVSPATDDPKSLLKAKMKKSIESPDNNEVDDAYAACSQSMHNLPSCGAEDALLKQACPSMSCDDLRKRCVSETATNKQKAEDLQRPMYRKDIFYSGSIPQLPEYKRHENVEDYVRSVTSVPSTDAGREAESPGFCKALTDSLKQMMDFSLLKNPVFVVYGISCFLCMAGFFVPFIYLPDLGIGFGLERKQAAFLISIIGIANTVARVACGWVSDQSWADCLIINNIALVAGGAATMLVPFFQTYWMLGTYSFVFGSCIAAFVSLRSIIMVEMMGLEKLTNAFGLVTLCQGLSSFIGAPIAGALYDATGHYNLSFYVAGATLALAGIICFPLRRIALCQRKKSLLAGEADGVVMGTDEVNIILSDPKNSQTPTGKLSVEDV